MRVRASQTSTEILLLVDTGVSANAALERAVDLARASRKPLHIIVRGRYRWLDRMAPVSGYVTWEQIEADRCQDARAVAQALEAKVPHTIACHVLTVCSWRDHRLGTRLSRGPQVVVPAGCIGLSLRSVLARRGREANSPFVVVPPPSAA